MLFQLINMLHNKLRGLNTGDYQHLTSTEKSQALTPYSLPIASDTVLGGIKVGTNLSIDLNGVLSAVAGGASVTYTNVIDICPSDPEVAGKAYQSIANAQTYLSTLAPAPSATNLWAIRVYGTNSENINIGLIPYVHYIGVAGLTRLTGQLTSTGTVTGLFLNDYRVSNCIITNLILGINSYCDFYNCEITGGTLASNSIPVFVDSIIKGGIFSWVNTAGLNFPFLYRTSIYGTASFVGASLFMSAILSGTTGFTTGSKYDFINSYTNQALIIGSGNSVSAFNSSFDGQITIQSGGSLDSAATQMLYAPIVSGTWTVTRGRERFPHNEATSIQGGTTGEYYHLTSEEKNQITLNQHNLMNGLQGGDSTSVEYYHITSTSHDNVEKYSPRFKDMLVGRDAKILDTNFTSLYAINNNGEAVGGNEYDGTVIYMDSTGTVSDLGCLGIPGASSAVPYDINDLGIIVGSCLIDSNLYGFYKEPDKDAILIPDVELYSINNNGISVGVNNSFELVTYDPINGFINLGNFGHSLVTPAEINDNGDICGSVYDSYELWFIRKANDPDNLIVDSTSISSYLYSINNDGDSAGYYNDGEFNIPLIRKSDGTLITVDIFTDKNAYFTKINDNGDAIGNVSDFGSSYSHGFIRLLNGTIIYCDDFNLPSVPLYGMNNSREIVGESNNSGTEQYGVYIPSLVNYIPDASTTTRGLIKLGNGFIIGERNKVDIDPSVINHNNLFNLQGGDTTSVEYYHLTEQEHTRIDELKETDTPSFHGITISNSRGGGLTRKTSSASATLSGATTTIQLDIPPVSRIIGIQLIVDEAITSGDGATTWSAGFVGGSSESICSGESFNKDTAINSFALALVIPETDIVITPNSGTFSGGVVTAFGYYEIFEPLSVL